MQSPAKIEWVMETETIVRSKGKYFVIMKMEEGVWVLSAEGLGLPPIRSTDIKTIMNVCEAFVIEYRERLRLFLEAENLG